MGSFSNRDDTLLCRFIWMWHIEAQLKFGGAWIRTLRSQKCSASSANSGESWYLFSGRYPKTVWRSSLSNTDMFALQVLYVARAAHDKNSKVHALRIKSIAF